PARAGLPGKSTPSPRAPLRRGTAPFLLSVKDHPQQPEHMTHIASPHNPRLKSLRRLRRRGERDRSGTFLAEGEDLVAAAGACGRPALTGFRLAGSAAGYEGFHEVDASALSAVSTLGSGTRVIAIYEQRWSEPGGPLCVYLHEVGDPGNVG